MTISVVVSTKGRRASLERLLTTLLGQSRRPEELVVVDADSDPSVEALVRGQERAFRVRYLPYPSSLTQARNHGVRNAAGEIVVFLDDDLLLDSEFIKEIAAPIERDPRIAAVTGNVVGHPRGKEPFKQAFKRFFFLPCDGSGRFQLSGAPTTPHGLPEEGPVEFVPGGLTAWRRSVFEEFQFDETLPGLGVHEDVDFSWRVSRKWRNWYTPKANVVHERPSLEREGTWSYLKQELSAYWRLFRKNQSKTPPRVLAFLWYNVGILVRFSYRRWLRP